MDRNRAEESYQVEALHRRLVNRLSTALILFLDGGAGHISVGAEDATIVFGGSQQSRTSGAFVEEQASVRGQFEILGMTTLGTSQSRVAEDSHFNTLRSYYRWLQSASVEFPFLDDIDDIRGLLDMYLDC